MKKKYADFEGITEYGPYSLSKNDWMKIPVSDKGSGPGIKHFDENQYSSLQSLISDGFNSVKTLLWFTFFPKNYKKEQVSSPQEAETTSVAKQLPEAQLIEESKTEAENTNPSFPVFLNSAFYKYLCNLIYSDSGVGKSILSIALGMSIEFKKCLYILVDNIGEKHLPRYFVNLGDKAILIPMKTFLQKADELNEEKIKKANFQKLLVYSLSNDEYRNYCRAEEIENRINKRLGLNENGNVIDDITVINAIITEAIDSIGVDFICIDSLNAIVGDSRKANRMAVRRILQKAVGNDITILCLHHTNKSGSMAGSSSISEEFDYVYRLSKEGSNDSIEDLQDNEEILLLEEKKARYSKPRKFRIKATFKNNLTPIYELLEQNKNSIPQKNAVKQKNLTTTIAEILRTRTCETITFEELIDLIDKTPKPHATSVKNCLLKLEIEGVVQKINNSWKKIKAIKR